MAVVSAMAVLFAIDAGVPASRAVGIGLAVGVVLGLILIDHSSPDIPSWRRGEGPAQLAAHTRRGLHRRRIPHLAISDRGPHLRIGGGPMDIAGVPMRRGSIVASGITLVALGTSFALSRDDPGSGRPLGDRG